MSWLTNIKKFLPIYLNPGRATQDRALSIKHPSTVALLTGGVSSLSGVTVNKDTAMAVSAVKACMDFYARNLATVPFKPMMNTQNGKEVARDHYTYNLMCVEPHPHYTPSSLKMGFIYNILGYGYGVIQIIRNTQTDEPIMLELRQSSQVKPWLDPDTKLLWFWDYENGELIPSRDVIYVPDPSTDPINPKSRLTIHRESIGLAISQVQAGANAAANGFSAAGFIKHPGTVAREKQMEIRSAVKSMLSGSANRGGVGFLEMGLDFMPVPMKLADQEYIASRKFQVEEIARIFNVPPNKIGHLEKSTFNNIEEENISAVENGLRPMAVQIEEEFNRKVFFPSERGTYYTKMELKGLLRGDIKTRTEFYQKMFDRGVFSPNNILELEDMNSVDGGDQRFIPLNMIPLDKASDYADNLIKQGEEPQMAEQ